MHRICVLSQLTNCPFSVLSVTSSEACNAIHEGRRQGALVNAEVPVAAIANVSSTLITRIPTRSSSQNGDDAIELLAKYTKLELEKLDILAVL